MFTDPPNSKDGYELHIHGGLKGFTSHADRIKREANHDAEKRRLEQERTKDSEQ